jgi:hypothetical protein
MEQKQENRKQPRRNAEKWSELIAAWRSSGRTRKAWCQEQGIAYESLRRWVKRLRGSADRLPFVEISKASQALDTTEQARLRVGKDGDIELYGNVSGELLRRVLRVMRETAYVH